MKDNNRNPQNNYKKQRRPRSQFAAERELEQKNTESAIVEGRNPVWEALCAKRPMDKLLISQGSAKSLGNIIATAKQAGIPIVECDRRKLDKMSETGSHQGVMAMCAAAQYVDIPYILNIAQSRGEKPLIILCDGVTDPHNLGAIIRTAEVVGAHGVVVPKHRSAGLGPACAKAAAGALEYLPVARCSNISNAIRELKEQNVFIFAADMGGEEMYSADFTIASAIIIGSEGDGISQTARKEADFVISIPQRGQVNSLNASNAAAVLLYEAMRRRAGK